MSSWYVLSLSGSSRRRLAIVLRALLIGQLVLSIFMVIYCYNASVKVMLLLKDIHKMKVLLVYGLILFQAYGMKLHYTSGLRLITWLLQCPSWKRVTIILRVWTISGSLLAANGYLVYIACSGTLKALIKELRSSLQAGISLYLTEPTWKKFLDTMQIELNCCGAERSNDWHEIPWIHMDVLNEDSPVVMKLAGADGRMLPPVTPFSCCSSAILSPCYHDPLQQVDWWSWRQAGSISEGSPSSGLEWAWSVGCAAATRAPLAKTLAALHATSLLVLLLQAIIVVAARVLHGSAAGAVLRGRAGGAGAASLAGAPSVQALFEAPRRTMNRRRRQSFTHRKP